MGFNPSDHYRSLGRVATNFARLSDYLGVPRSELPDRIKYADADKVARKFQQLVRSVLRSVHLPMNHSVGQSLANICSELETQGHLLRGGLQVACLEEGRFLKALIRIRRGLAGIGVFAQEACYSYRLATRGEVFFTLLAQAIKDGRQLFPVLALAFGGLLVAERIR